MILKVIYEEPLGSHHTLKMIFPIRRNKETVNSMQPNTHRLFGEKLFSPKIGFSLSVGCPIADF